jgi:riboflavin biosynthesis pyrimidine reductase
LPKAPAPRRSGALAPLETLLPARLGREVPLPAELKRLYGKFRLPVVRSKAWVCTNFVSTLDGVVSLHTKGHAAGGDISGFSTQDRMVMGLVRAVADVVIVGSGSLKADPQAVWTPEAICPELASGYRRLRTVLGKRGPALNVIVSASGALDLALPVFSSGQVPALILTTEVGAKRLNRHKLPAAVQVRALRRGAGEFQARLILRELSRRTGIERVLVEGGPNLLGDFYKQRLIDEQFLTLAPQIAGREVGDGRPGLVMGQTFAPRDSLWGDLIDVRRGSSHLYLRYSFA